ncbi:MAG: allantoinase [Brevibacillus sp.]|nr:allantoinase [Brevibacillus sp.]
MKLHIYQCTFPRIFDLIRHYQSRGATVIGETCAHYLALEEQDIVSLKAKAKIYPPLSSADDVEKLWEQIAQGMVDIVTSNHAPWTIERKNKANIFENSLGTPGVETLLPLMYSEGENHHSAIGEIA